MKLPKEKPLQWTATWAVAVVCFVLVAISIVIEKLIHHAELWLKKKRKLPLCEALGIIKAELMLLGFISLLLTVMQESLSDICVPKSVAYSWHPCTEPYNQTKYYDPCVGEGEAQLISAYGIHQLHIFIFVLALTHVIYCVVTYAFGKLKMRQWKVWEDETKTVEYQYYNDPERFRFTRETSFGRRHLHFWSQSSILLWIVSFFRQFYPSVAKVDYLTLRQGFINEHLPPQSQGSFDFQKYINRALEEDFKVIVGISPALWFCAVLLLLTNTNGWYSHFWLPYIPLIIILLVGGSALRDCEIPSFNELLCKIESRKAPPAHRDYWKWELEKAGEYSVKSSYLYLVSRKIDFNKGNAIFCKLLWNNDAVEKAKALAWRVVFSKIATKSELRRRGVFQNNVAVVCAICGTNDETVKHLFFECRPVCDLWDGCLEWIGVQAPLANTAKDNLLQFCSLLRSKARRTLLAMLWICVVWNTWKVRNNVIFNNGVWNHDSIVGNIKSFMWLWVKSSKTLANPDNSFRDWSIRPW